VRAGLGARLDPGQTIDFPHPLSSHLAISLGGGENEIETLFGKHIAADEPLGTVGFINEMRRFTG
jgi:hypothetical protein